MRFFFIELARSLATTWSKMWRWAFRRPLNLVVTVAALVVIVAVIAVALRPSTVPTIAAPMPTPTPTAAPVPMVEVTATPIDGGSSQGSETDAAEQPELVDTASLDLNDAEAVAQSWAANYFTRQTPEDDAWIAAVESYTTPDLIDELARMAFLEGTPLDGAQETAVTGTTIAPRVADAEASTPIRWSKTLVVEVTDNQAKTTTLSYSVVLYLTDDGWKLTSVELLSLEEG